MKAQVAATRPPTTEFCDHSSLPKRVGANSLWLLFARILSQGLMLWFTALVARALGEVGLGQYAFIASVVFVGNMVTTFGMDTLLIREIARTRTTSTLLIPAALWIQIALSAVFIACILFVTEALSDKTAAGFALAIYSTSLVPLAVYTIFSAILRAYERMDAFLALNVVTAILQALSAIVVVSLRADLTTLIYLLLFSQFAAALLAVALCARLIPDMTFRWRIPVRAALSIARVALPIAVLIACGVLYQRIGILVLPMLAGDAVTGWFSAAARIVEALKLVPQSLLGAIFPLMSRWAIAPHQARLFRTPLILSMSFGALAALGVSAAAPFLIDLVYGARFAESAGALQIIVWGLIPYAFTATVTLELIANGQERRVLAGNVLGVAIALFLYLSLVPNYGLSGACWASVVAEWLLAGVFLALSKSLSGKTMTFPVSSA